MSAQATVAPTDPGAALTELRLALRRHGYRPVPVSGSHLAIKSAGKRPLMRGWETLCADAGEDEIRRWTRDQRNCTNTGLLCGDIVGVDIDVPLAEPAAAIEALARDMLGDTPLKRIGRAPSCCWCCGRNARSTSYKHPSCWRPTARRCGSRCWRAGNSSSAPAPIPIPAPTTIGPATRRSTCRRRHCPWSIANAAPRSSPKPRRCCAAWGRSSHP